MTTAGPISTEYREQMNDLARWLDAYWNGPAKGNGRKVGFCLLVFPFGEADPHRDRINYISNANRRDMITAMKELIARFEGHDHAAPRGKQ